MTAARLMATGLRRRLWVVLALSPMLAATVASADWSGVGQLHMPRGEMCGATLIGPDLAVTAAHCVFDPQSGRLRETRDLGLVFQPNAQSRRREVRVGTIIPLPRFRHNLNASTATIGSDVALLALAVSNQPIAGVTYPVGPPPAPPAKLLLVDPFISRADVRVRECDLHGVIGAVAAVGCLVSEGLSGAPVFAMAGPTARLVGVVSARGRSEVGPIALISRVDLDISALFAELCRRRESQGISVCAPDRASSSEARPLFAPLPRKALGRVWPD